MLDYRPKTEKDPIRVLHVDDDLSFLEISKTILHEIDNRFIVDFATEVNAAVRKILEKTYDVIISDYEMPQKNGLDFLKELKEKGIALPFILFTGKGREEIAIQALNLGANGYYNKQGSPETVYGELSYGIKMAMQHKKAEEKLLESENKYRDIFENARDAIYVHDVKGNILSINKVVEEYGFTKDQVIGKNVLKFMPKKYWPKLIVQIAQLSKGQRIEGEIEVNTPSGKRYAEYRSNPIIRGNKVIAAHAVLRDTTEKKKTEKALLENQQKFKALFAANPEAAVFVNEDFQVIEANSKFNALFGFTMEEIEGKIITDLVVPLEAEEEAAILRKKIIQGPIEIVTRRKRKDGQPIPLIVSGGPVNIEGRFIGLVIVYKDISEIIMVQEELSKALTKSELLNEKLSVLGGFMRHDVRNKLTVASGNLYLAEKYAEDSQRQQTFLNQIKLSISNVERILDFAKDFEMLGSQELTMINVGEAFEKASSLFPDLKGIKVINECKDVRVFADPMLTTVLHNLIDNSLKYGGPNLTQIKITRIKQGISHKIIYQDNGAGIDSKTKKQLFNKGVGKGTGYGLYLIKRTCEIYGWAVTETGQSDVGACFEFTIPSEKIENVTDF